MDELQRCPIMTIRNLVVATLTAIALALPAIAKELPNDIFHNPIWMAKATPEMVQAALDQGIDPNATHPDSRFGMAADTPLMVWAARSNDLEVGRLLLAAGADPAAYSVSNGGRAGSVTVLHVLGYEWSYPGVPSQVAKFWLLVDAGSDVNAMSKNGTTADIRPIDYAKSFDKPELMQAMIDAGSDPGMFRGMTSLHYTVKSHPKFRSRYVSPEAALVVLQAGVDPDLPIGQKPDGARREELIGLRAVDLARQQRKFRGTQAMAWLEQAETARIARLDRGAPDWIPAEICLEKGDMLSAIASVWLGEQSRWQEIATLNDIEASGQVRIGDCLAMPAR